MRLFLVAGKAGCGKNEVAKLLKEKLGNSVITSFSKYIKLFALELSDWDGSDFNKPRSFLQLMGDKLRRIDVNFLTKRILEDLKVYENEGIANVIISDVRMVNEIEYFKNIGNIQVITIRVNCDSCKRKLTLDEKNHITELELDNYDYFDYVIDNEFDEKLDKDINKMLEGLK
ncbi:MAG: hypothetical protein IJ475_01930 [Bacilli bacterium]|nr:hypothetical protein [Bacilli bacterium]